MEHCKYLERQYLNEHTADFVFIINEGKQSTKIPAHKVILAANSQKLEKQFNEVADSKTITINSVAPKAFKEFLYAFYAKHPEKIYTIANVGSVLHLARAFDFSFGLSSCEKFLLDNLSDGQMCFGFCVAKKFELCQLKAHCQLQINKKKAVALKSQAFFAYDADVFYDLLSNLMICGSDEIKLVWNACLFWVQIQRGKPGVDASNIQKHLELLCNHFVGIGLENEDFQTYAKVNYKDLFISNALIDTQPVQRQLECRDKFVAVRLLDTMLATQICSTNDPVKIELKSTKRIILNGLAFSTVTGSPQGNLSIAKHCDEGDLLLTVQNLRPKLKVHHPRNVIAIERSVILEPNQFYTISVELSQDVVYYRSYSIQNNFNKNGLDITFKMYSGRDIFSHFFFSI